ncbi:hypothetical protein GCM10010216_10870 [Streptomyces flaveolus]|nr:hypothetical protein GCM10010216_10870 [Streptomyces flaveolus]
MGDRRTPAGTATSGNAGGFAYRPVGARGVSLHGGSLVRGMARMYRLTGQERRGVHFACQSIAQTVLLLAATVPGGLSGAG